MLKITFFTSAGSSVAVRFHTVFTLFYTVFMLFYTVFTLLHAVFTLFYAAFILFSCSFILFICCPMLKMMHSIGGANIRELQMQSGAHIEVGFHA